MLLSLAACLDGLVVTRTHIGKLPAIFHVSVLPFEQVLLLHRAIFAAFLVISQVGPILFPPTQGEAISGRDLNHLASLSSFCRLEATQSLAVAEVPFPPGTTIRRQLKTKVVDWVIKARVDNEPEVLKAKVESTLP